MIISQVSYRTNGPLVYSCKNLCMIHRFFFHYENMPLQDTEIFIAMKNENFQQKKIDIFLIFAPDIDCGYMLELPHFGAKK